MTHHARHWFLPHHTNNYRARLLHVDLFAVYILFLVVTLSILRFTHILHPTILGFATNITVDELLTDTNAKRTINGLGSLRLDPQLSQAAAAKAADMFKKDYWAHNAPDGVTPWDFINGVGYVYVVAGENLAKNFDNSAGVVEAWMNSPSHRENLLRKQYDDVGFAIVNGILNGEETTLVVQMFGHRLDTAAVPKTDTTGALVGGVQAVADAPQAQITKPPVVIDDGAARIDGQTNPQAQSVTTTPLFDIGELAKKTSLFLSLALIAIVMGDSIYIWRHRIVRVSGKAAAHLIFLTSITGFAWLLSLGNIL